jgi:hypothetical protein
MGEERRSDVRPVILVRPGRRAATGAMRGGGRALRVARA